MAITRWDPFSETMSLRQVMDRLFEDAWVHPGRFMGREAAEVGTLPLDVHETPDELVVTASLPGVKPEDIDLTIQGDVLRIQGEMKRREDIKEEQIHRQERQFGRFYREVMLPMSVKSDAIQAHFENGVLTLRLPKAEEAKPRWSWGRLG
jgi:HSP20 family protein